MNEHHRDIFCNTDNRPLKQKIEILEWAKEHCFEWCVDILDCSKSWARKRIEMSWEDIMKKFDEKAYLVVIHRRGYENWKGKDPYRWCLEVGFRESNPGPEHFLWIYCDEKYVEEIRKKFKLTTK